MLKLVAKSNLYATQARSAANLHADMALELFDRDSGLTDEFHQIQGGKWNQSVMIFCLSRSRDLQAACFRSHTSDINIGKAPHGSLFRQLHGYLCDNHRIKMVRPGTLGSRSRIVWVRGPEITNTTAR